MKTPVSYNVNVRSRSDCFYARCEGLTASCTYSQEEAAARAAAKAFARFLKRKFSSDVVALQRLTDVAGSALFVATIAERSGAK